MLTAKLMHPESFAIQMEAYNSEKSEPGREREAAKILAEMIRRSLAGLGTNQILFCWLFTFKDLLK